MTAFDFRPGNHPVDARLSPADDGWRLELKVRYRFDSDPQDSALLARRKAAALRGILSWQGSYPLPDGSCVHVRIRLCHSRAKRNAALIVLHAPRPFKKPAKSLGAIDRQFNRLFARSYGFRLCDLAQRIAGLLQLPRRAHRLRCDHFSLMGLDWHTCASADLGESLAKHEFGHLLGLGDLYQDLQNVRWLRLAGVPPERFPALTPHYCADTQRFRAVMDDNGPVLPSDIEMVIEAFASGQRQNYQPQPLFGSDISPVLTRSR